MITQQANDAIIKWVLADCFGEVVNGNVLIFLEGLKDYLNSITEHEPEYTLGAEGLREFPSKTYPSSEIAHGYDQEGK